MSHVSTTAHYNLPIYGGTDIINPLTDVNGTNEALDTAIYEVAQELASGVTDITDVKNKVGDASLDTASQNLSGAVNELKSAIDTQGGDITDVEANVGTLQSQMATATGNITTLNTTVAGLQTEVSGKASQSAVNTLATKVGTDALITTADNLSGAVNELKNDIDGIVLDADNVTYDNTTSDLTATNVQSAIDEVNAKYSPTRPADVTVTGNGVKTLGQCLTELADALDLSKVTMNSKLVMTRGTDSYVALLTSILQNGIGGGYLFPIGDSSGCTLWAFNAYKTGAGSSVAVATYTRATGNQVGNDASIVVTSGDKFEFYY